MGIATFPNGRPYLHCTRCRMSVIWPTDMVLETKAAFASSVRDDIVRAMRNAESQFGLDSRESKVLVLHITREPNVCHKCKKSVVSGESICSCKSVNLNW